MEDGAAPIRMGIIGSWVMTSWHGGRYRPLVNDEARLALGPAEGKRVLAEAIERRAVIQCWEPCKWFTMHPEWKRAQKLLVTDAQPPQSPAIERINLMAIRWKVDGCAAEADAYFRQVDAYAALGVGRKPPRSAWRVADSNAPRPPQQAAQRYADRYFEAPKPAGEVHAFSLAPIRETYDGREVWHIDEVKDWTVRILFEIAAELHALESSDRARRGVVHESSPEYDADIRLFDDGMPIEDVAARRGMTVEQWREQIGSTHRTLYYPTSPNGAAAARFSSDAEWALDAAQNEFEVLSKHVVSHSKGTYCSIHNPSADAIKVFMGSLEGTHRQRGRAALALWIDMGIEACAVNDASIEAAWKLVDRRRPTLANWVRETKRKHHDGETSR